MRRSALGSISVPGYPAPLDKGSREGNPSLLGSVSGLASACPHHLLLHSGTQVHTSPQA